MIETSLRSIKSGKFRIRNESLFEISPKEIFPLFEWPVLKLRRGEAWTLHDRRKLQSRQIWTCSLVIAEFDMENQHIRCFRRIRTASQFLLEFFYGLREHSFAWYVIRSLTVLPTFAFIEILSILKRLSDEQWSLNRISRNVQSISKQITRKAEPE